MNDEHFKFYDGIVSSFEGACGRFLRKSDKSKLAALWLVSDHALLACQEPAYVVLWRRGRDGYIARYSSLSSADRDFLGLRGLAEEALSGDRDDLFYVEDATRELAIGLRALPNRNQVRQKPSGLNQELLGTTLRRLLESGRNDLRAALDAYSVVADQHLCAEEVGRLAEEQKAASADYDALLAPLRVSVGRVLEEVGRCKLTEDDAPESTALNLFAVVRVPSSGRLVVPPVGKYDVPRRSVRYPYTVGMLLGRSHRQWIEDCGRPTTALERVLDDGYRSIADTPLSQGNIDFGTPNEHVGTQEWSRQYYPEKDGQEAAREKREDALFEMIRKDSEERSIFYIPIHLGGVPWLALFTFGVGKQLDSMKRNFLIYRDLVPLLSEGLSRAVQQVFADTVATIVVESFERASSVDDFIASANHRLSILSRIYPYPQAVLSTSGGKSEQIAFRETSREWDAQVFLGWVESNLSLPFRLLDIDVVKRSIEQEIQRAVSRTQSGYKDALMVFGHYLGGLVQESGFGAALAEGEQVLKKHPDTRQLADLLRFADSRIALVAGLGEAIRLRKTRGRGFPRNWFSSGDWRKFDTKELLEMAANVCLYYLEPRWRQSNIPWRAQVRWNDNVYRLPGEEGFIKSRARPELPPFAGPGDRRSGTLSVSLGLAEIIRNACSVVDGILGALPPKVAEIPLIDIVAAIRGTDEPYLEVTVTNVTRVIPKQESIQSITEVRSLEDLLMKIDGESVVETSWPEPARDHVNPQLTDAGFLLARANWRYYYNRVQIACPREEHNHEV